MSNLQRLRALYKYVCKLLVDTLLYVDSVGCNARLTGMSEFERHQCYYTDCQFSECTTVGSWEKLTIGSLFQVRVIEDEEWAVSTKFKCQLLQAIRAVLCNQLSNSRLYMREPRFRRLKLLVCTHRSGEADFLNSVVAAQLFA